MRRLAGLAILLVTLTATSGCVQYSASKVPENLLDGQAGNGWVLTEKDPRDEARSESFGLAKSRTFTYRDDGDQGGYPASLTVVSFQVAFNTPDRDEITDRAQQRVEEEADRLGVELDKPPQEAERQVRSGDQAAYFLYDGEAEDEGGLFAQRADIKVVGAVWNCKEGGGNSVVAVGLAQVTETEETGGIYEDTDRDETNWREMWEDADPGSGGADGGLIVNVTCG